MAKILVVDDEPSIIHFVTEVLQMHGHEVLTAVNGNDAAKYWDKGLKLVVTDLVMPEKNGINMIQEMRRQSPQTKVIAMSGGTGFSGEIDLLEVAKLLGVDAILHKPFSPKELTDAVDAAIA